MSRALAVSPVSVLFRFLVLAFPLLCTPARAADPLEACALLTAAEFQQITGRTLYFEPEAMSLDRGAGSSCGYETGQLIVYSGNDSQKSWENLLARYEYAETPRTPVADLGDHAYSFLPTPHNKYEDTNAFVVVSKGQVTFAVSVATLGSETAEQVLPLALQLARSIVVKLP